MVIEASERAACPHLNKRREHLGVQEHFNCNKVNNCVYGRGIVIVLKAAYVHNRTEIHSKANHLFHLDY